MPRVLFEKKGNAIWISHLDLMRLFQRAFKRVGLPLMHTQGYNPRPYVAVALPLSVGVESGCELLDFDLEGEAVPGEQIKARLNGSLVDGVRVLDVLDDGRKIRDLALLECAVDLEYDQGVPTGAEVAIRELFSRESLVVEKKSKNGPTQQDITPMIRSLEVLPLDGHTLRLHGVVCCQNPSLNPMQLSAAIGRYLPEFAPDFARSCRIEIYDAQMKIFR